jgi:hypothetical protein
LLTLPVGAPGSKRPKHTRQALSAKDYDVLHDG